jgi:hypothetical protein
MPDPMADLPPRLHVACPRLSADLPATGERFAEPRPPIDDPWSSRASRGLSAGRIHGHTQGGPVVSRIARPRHRGHCSPVLAAATASPASTASSYMPWEGGFRRNGPLSRTQS